MQLKYRIDPELLYRKTYSHLTSLSPISQDGNMRFLEYVSSKISQKQQVLEIGCNDLFLLKKLKKFVKHRVGIDPIHENEKIEVEPGLHVHGGFIESIDLNNLVEQKIDLLMDNKLTL